MPPTHTLESYRKIAQVTNVSKIVESAIFKFQIQPKVAQALPSNLYGYAEKKGCKDTILDPREIIVEQQLSPDVVATVNCDSQKAFQSVPHSVIHLAYKNPGAEKKILNIIDSYLHRQSQFVRIGPERSELWSSKGMRVFPGVFSAGLTYNLATSAHTTIHAINFKNSFKYGDDEAEIVTGTREDIAPKITTAIKGKTRIQVTGMQIVDDKIVIVN